MVLLGLAIHAIAITNCNKYFIICSLQAIVKKMNALKTNTWGSYTYRIMWVNQAVHSTVHCRVMLHLRRSWLPK